MKVRWKVEIHRRSGFQLTLAWGTHLLAGVLKGRQGGGEEEGVVVQVDGADDGVVLPVAPTWVV